MRYPETPAQAHLEIISPNGEIYFYSLNPGGSIRLGQHPENELALEGPGIAPFHLILDHCLPTYRLLLLSQKEETWLNGQLLSPHSTIELQPLDLIKIGSYVLILLADQPQEAQTVTPAPFNSSPLLFEDLIEVTLSSRHASTEVAQIATYHIALVNKTTDEITAQISVDGIEQNWTTITPSLVKLLPGKQVLVSLCIIPPPLPSSSAGSHTLTIVVTSSDYPDWRTAQEVILLIKPAYDFVLSDLTPKLQHLPHFQPVGQTCITLTNHSNCPALFQLCGVDSAKTCHFEFQLPDENACLVAAATLRLSAGQTVSIPIRITLPARPWIGPGRCSYPYTLQVTLLDGRPMPRILSGQVTSAPLIGPWLITFAIFCLVTLLTWGTQMLLERMWGRPIFVSLVTPTSTPLPSPHLATATATPAIPPVATPALTYEEIFQKVALQYGLDWQILAGVAYQESRLNHLAVGRDNDMGLMQILPATWNEWAPKVGVSDPFDPYSNVLVAAAYLAYLRDYCQARGYHDTYWMLIGYNWGPRNLRQLIDSQGSWNEVPEKQRYYALTILQSTSAGPIYQQILTQK